MNEVFLDTSYAVALVFPFDRHHERALDFADHLAADRSPLVTSRAVVIEIGNALARPRFRLGCVRLLEMMEVDPQLEIIEVEQALYHRALDLYRNRPDKDWGMTDCISFVIMQERGITDALTADDHFRQAGFRALLQEDS
jgi:predicted nucleic acid-binding protein